MLAIAWWISRRVSPRSRAGELRLRIRILSADSAVAIMSSSPVIPSTPPL
jgi:hypothetical protein